jgi:hypothetical protein
LSNGTFSHFHTPVFQNFIKLEAWLKWWSTYLESKALLCPKKEKKKSLKSLIHYYLLSSFLGPYGLIREVILTELHKEKGINPSFRQKLNTAILRPITL